MTGALPWPDNGKLAKNRILFPSYPQKGPSGMEATPLT